jgi:F420-0:gamma-glutamyl ligase-like protein
MLPGLPKLAPDWLDQSIASSLISGGQFSLLTTTINQQKTDVPLLEQEIISKVASYGKQLGRLIEAVNVLAKHPDESIPIAERKPLDELVELAAEITTAREEFTRDHVEEILASIKVLGRPDHVDHEALQKIRQLVDELDTPGP